MKNVIAMTVSHRSVVRSVLQTPFFIGLAKEFKIILIVSSELGEVVQEIVLPKGVHVHHVSLGTLSFREKILSKLTRLAVSTGTSYVMQWRAWCRHTSHIHPYVKFCMGVFLSAAPIRIILRFFDRYIVPSVPEIERIIKINKPQLIISTAIVGSAFDAACVREAKRKKIKTVGMVRSWDNLTNGSGLIRVLPDYMFAQSPYIAKAACMYHGMVTDRIKIIGLHQYDLYDPNYIVSRDQFCKELGLNPEKKIVVYGAVGQDLYPKEPMVLDLISELGKKDCKEVQFIYRVHPAFPLKSITSTSASSIYIDNPEIIPEYARLQVETGSVVSPVTIHIANLLAHADVVVTSGSTFMVDSTVVGTPCIFLALEDSSIGYWDSISRFCDTFSHIVSFMKVSRMPVAKTRNCLVSFLKDTLSEGSSILSGKEIITKEFIGKLPPGIGAQYIAEINQILHTERI